VTCAFLAKYLMKRAFYMRFRNLFLQGTSDPYDMIHFEQPEAIGDGYDIPLEHPAGWSREAVEVLADEAAASALSPDLKPIEENTVPSWLWRQSLAKFAGKKESSVRVLFDRVAGAATYQGWKQKLFADEESARVFYDEARYALAQRFIALEPQKLGQFGLKWAYGIDFPPVVSSGMAGVAIDVSNTMIDTIVSGRRDHTILNRWQKIIGARLKESKVALRFTDTVAQWEKPLQPQAGARLNLMAFRHNDGSVNIEALRHAVRLTVLLVDLQDEAAGHSLAIGYANLAPLLMALALPYDSDAGRATASAISAIITAEAYAVSAELAALRGASPEFTAHRTASLRALRNHRRAAYGEHNDYEKISILPTPLALASCPDLNLTAAARGAWDRALELVQAHGLRHTQVTGLFSSPALTLFMECGAEGLMPMSTIFEGEGEVSQRVLHSSATEALTRLGYEAKKVEAVSRHVAGTLSLEQAPGINPAVLRERGFTEDVLQKLEQYLPQARKLRFAFTPWVLGTEFCRKVLKVPAAKIEDMRFNLLAYLGFSDAEIAIAEAWCYGSSVIDSSRLLEPQHAHVFATAASLPSEAVVRMAAAVQGFVSGGTDLQLLLPLGLQAEQFEKLLLDVWRRGVKSIAIVFDSNLKPQAVKNVQDVVRRRTLRKIAASVYMHAKAPALPKRRARSSTSRLTGMPQGKGKSRSASKGH
jgi:hypothetical protein